MHPGFGFRDRRCWVTPPCWCLKNASMGWIPVRRLASRPMDSPSTSRRTRSYPWMHPGAARRSQKYPGAPKSRQAEPGVPKSCTRVYEMLQMVQIGRFGVCKQHSGPRCGKWSKWSKSDVRPVLLEPGCMKWSKWSKSDVLAYENDMPQTTVGI